LRAEDVANLISLKLPADKAIEPMRILQHAIAVIRRSDAKIGFEAFPPGFWQIARRSFPF
jgi:hypothetical protein